MARNKFKYTPYARFVPLGENAFDSLLKPPGYLQNLEIWYTADAPSAGGRPFDRGLQELGEMAVVDSQPSLSASAAPDGKAAWIFDLTGRFIDEEASVSVASEPFTMAVICRVTGSSAVQDIFRAGETTTPYIRATVGGGTIQYAPDGDAVNDVETGDGEDEKWHIIVYQRSGSLDRIYSATLGNVDGMAGSEAAIGSTDLWSETELGGIGANEFDGYVAQALAWSDKVEHGDIWLWARNYYGFSAITADFDETFDTGWDDVVDSIPEPVFAASSYDETFESDWDDVTVIATPAFTASNYDETFDFDWDGTPTTSGS